MKKIILKILALFGYKILKSKEPMVDPRGHNFFGGYDFQEEGEKAVRLTAEYSMMPYLNLHTLYEQAVYCEKQQISGDFVECGVWKGGAVGIMALANLKHSSSRRDLHLFDAFDDICAPDIEKDGQRALEEAAKHSNLSLEDLKGQLVPLKGAYDSLGGYGTEDICKELIIEKIGYPKENVIFHKGWFQDTVPVDKANIDKIAILRLDGDWYDSIKVCLDNLYDKVEKGGLIVIDDYGYYEGCTNAVNDFFKERNIKAFLSYSTVGCRYFVKS